MPKTIPPMGPEWDLPLQQTPFVFVDLEMTGLSVEEDRIVELCMERVQGGSLQRRLWSLVDAGDRAGGGSEIHGLEASHLKGALPFSRLSRAVTDIVGGAVFVAHAARWDIAFLSKEMDRSGFPYTQVHYLDTLVLARRVFGFPSCSLDALCERFSIPRGKVHRAAADVGALRQVFEKVVEALGAESARDLWEVRTGGKWARRSIVDACRKAAADGKPVRVTYRPARRPREELVLVFLQVEEGKDVPFVRAYDTTSRARRELRADRILRVAPFTPSP